MSMHEHKLPRRQKAQAGYVIAETLVAIALLGIILAGTTAFMFGSMHANTTARSFESLTNDIQELVEGYRSGSYATLLAKFGTSYTAIANNQTATETVSSAEGRATLAITYTAIKNNTTSSPEAIKMKIVATQRRGKFGRGSYTFETIISEPM